MQFNRVGDNEDDRVTALINDLKRPITAHGLTLKQHLVQTLIPAAKKMKAIHATLESQVDIPFETGLLEFNDASKMMENLAIYDEDDLKTTYAATQGSCIIQAWSPS